MCVLTDTTIIESENLAFPGFYTIYDIFRVPERGGRYAGL
jgi:hypothetical protein